MSDETNDDLSVSPEPWAYRDGYVVDPAGNVVSIHVPANSRRVLAIADQHRRMLELLTEERFICAHAAREIAQGGPPAIVCSHAEFNQPCWEHRRRALVAEIDGTKPTTLDETIAKAVNDRMRFIAANREKLIEAWVAETGLSPSESELVETCSADGLTVTATIRRRGAKPTPGS